jgi:N-glycosidase YbiA
VIVRLKDNLIVITAETPEEQSMVAVWAKAADGNVFVLKHQDQRTFRLIDLGTRPDACREPINVTSRSPDAMIRLISNLAHTPFELDGNAYASVEAFWQGLKFPDIERRRQIASLYGIEARRAGFDAEASDTLVYCGRTIRVGTSYHWHLMYLACRAKFSQHEQARAALVGTGDRPLMHQTRRDSRTIPGVVMADIWMRIRRTLAQGGEVVEEDVAGDEVLRHHGADVRPLRSAADRGVEMSSDTLVIPADNRILYFERDREVFGFLSHFHPAPVVLDGEVWPTVEHYYQAQKPHDPAYRQGVRDAASPGIAKRLAAQPAAPRRVSAQSWFRKHRALPRSDWQEVKLGIMRRADLAKFTQHPHLAARLMATGTAQLVEDSPSEPYWGTGPDGQGANWAGRVLMEIREALRATPREGSGPV